MAGERTLPGIGLEAFWTPGSSGWGDDMNVNLRKLSALVQLSALSLVAAVPDSPADGDIHILTDGQIAVRDSGAWVYITPGAGFLAWVEAEADFYVFDGTDWALAFDVPEVGASGPGSFSSLIVTPNDPATIQAPTLPGVVARIVGAVGAMARMTIEAFAGNPQFTSIRSNGTPAAPTGVKNTNNVGGFAGFGAYETAGVFAGYSPIPQANVLFLATEDWTELARGTKMELRVTKKGTTAQATLGVFDADTGIKFQVPVEQIATTGAASDPVNVGGITFDGTDNTLAIRRKQSDGSIRNYGLTGAGGGSSSVTRDSLPFVVSAWGPARSIIEADGGKIHYVSAGGDQQHFLTTDATFNFPVGTMIGLCQAGAGSVWFSPQAGVTLYVPGTSGGSGNAKTKRVNSTIYVRKLAANTWLATGELL